MKKTKRLLSMLTALAITATSFAAMVIPASAADDGATLYSQDFEAVEVTTEKSETTTGAADWTTGAAKRSTPVVLNDATAGIGHFLTMAQDERGHNGTTMSSPALDITTDRYAIEFDLKLGSSADQLSSFELDDKNGNAFFKLEQTAKSGNVWQINNNADLNATMPKAGNDRSTISSFSDTASLDKLGWYHVLIQYAEGAMYVTVQDKADSSYVSIPNDKTLNKTLVTPLTTEGGVKYIKFNTGKTTENFAIDNILIRNLNANEVSETKYYTLTLNTTRYATVKYTRSDMAADGEKTAYADENGKLDITLIEGGSTVSYAISKTGYTSAASQTVTMDETKAIDCALTATDAIKDYVYYEPDFGNADGAIKMTADGRLSDIALGDIELPDLFEINFDVNIPNSEKTQVSIAFTSRTGGNTDTTDIFGIQGITAGGTTSYTVGTGDDAQTIEKTYEAGLYAFSDLHPSSNSTTTKGWNQSCQGLWTEGVKLADTYVGEYTVSMVVDKVNKKATVKVGDNPAQLLSFTKDANLKYLRIGKAEKQTSVTIDNIIIKAPDANYVQLLGNSNFAKISGKTLEKQYTASPAVIVDGETFAWSLTAPAGAAADGVTLDQTGKLTVNDTATAGTYTITATSSESASKKGSIDVEIADFQKLNIVAEGPKTFDKNDKAGATYTITSATDGLGANVTEDVPAVVWTSTDENVVSIDASTGAATVEGAGDANIIATITNGTQVSKASIPVKVAAFDIKAAATDNSTTLTLDDIYVGDDVKAYKIYRVKDNALVDPETYTDKGTITAEALADNLTQNTTTKNVAAANAEKIVVTYDETGLPTAITATAVAQGEEVEIPTPTATSKTFLWDMATLKPVTTENRLTVKNEGTLAVDTTGADSVELVPIFETTIGNELNVPSETYNITVSANNENRADVYVNNQMVMNNLNQGSVETGGKWEDVSGARPESATYTINDIKIKEGYARFKYEDKTGSPVSGIKFVKAPDGVDRVRKVYAIGDSLVCNYYDRVNAPKGEEFCRTGWGQVIDNYLKDVEVVNLGNSGAWATGMYHDAFTQVRESAVEGDIVLWESGYNDRNHSNETDMKAAITAAVEECKELGVDIYLITPNASAHDLKDSPNWAGYMRDLNVSTNAPLIDLAKLSFKFLGDNYGPITNDGTYNHLANDAYTATELKYFHHEKDSLHSTTNAAHCWAAMVARGLYDAGKTSIVNTDYEYTFTDDSATPKTFTISTSTVPAAADLASAGE